MSYLIRTTLLLALVGLPVVTAATGSLRCGTQLVQQGMQKSEVRRLCGEPAALENDGNVWIYDQSPNQLLRAIIFVRDEVEFIEERPRRANEAK